MSCGEYLHIIYRALITTLLLKIFVLVYPYQAMQGGSTDKSDDITGKMDSFLEHF